MSHVVKVTETLKESKWGGSQRHHRESKQFVGDTTTSQGGVTESVGDATISQGVVLESVGDTTTSQGGV